MDNQYLIIESIIQDVLNNATQNYLIYQKEAKYSQIMNTDSRFKADYCIKELKLLIEVEGGTWSKGKSGHTSGKGYQSNCEKYNIAAKNGWIVLRYTTNMITNRKLNGQIYNDILDVIKLREV